MDNIILYTDNGCDLDNSILESLGVKKLHMSTIINGTTYIDRLTIEPPDFYRLLEEPGVIPTTSQLNLAAAVQEFESSLENNNNHIIYIAFSGALSGTFQTACIARDMVDSERITILDTRGASIGQGLIVMRAAQAIAAGQSKQEVIAEIEQNISRMQYIFIVGNFEMLKRGGRVNPAAAALGDLLNIKLILHFRDGSILPLEKVHGLKRAKKKLLDIMESRGHDLKNQTIGLSYSKDLPGALEIKQMIEERFGVTDFVFSEIGSLIGSHVGPGTFAVFFLSK